MVCSRLLRGTGVCRPLPKGPSRTSFTLIEVLLALSLATLLVTVTGRIVLQSLITRQDVTRMVATLQRKALLFERLAADFANLLPGLPGEETPLMVFGTRQRVLQLNTLSPVQQSFGSLHLTRLPSTVRYRFVGNPHDGEVLDLIRETIDRTSRSAPPIRQTVARGVVSFKVEVLTKDKWTEKYPSTGERTPVAEAVRVSIRWVGSSQSTIRTFVVRHAD